jgi:hypothetical protein
VPGAGCACISKAAAAAVALDDNKVASELLFVDPARICNRQVLVYVVVDVVDDIVASQASGTLTRFKITFFGTNVASVDVKRRPKTGLMVMVETHCAQVDVRRMHAFHRPRFCRRHPTLSRFQSRLVSLNDTHRRSETRHAYFKFDDDHEIFFRYIPRLLTD